MAIHVQAGHVGLHDELVVHAVGLLDDAAILRRVFVGGVIPAQDYDMLHAAGVAGIYGPGTAIPACAADVLAKIRAARAAV